MPVSEAVPITVGFAAKVMPPAVVATALWFAQRAGDESRTREGRNLLDIDSTLVTAHSEKQNAAPNFKRGFGFHPVL